MMQLGSRPSNNSELLFFRPSRPNGSADSSKYQCFPSPLPQHEVGTQNPAEGEGNRSSVENLH